MAEAITYCDGCRRMIRPSEISDGHAAVTGAAAFCPECIETLSPEERAALRRGTERERRAKTSEIERARPVSGAAHRTAEGARGPVSPAVLGAVVGFAVMMLVVAVIVVFRGGDEPPADPTPPGSVFVPPPVVKALRAPPVSAAADSGAAKMFRDARDLVTADLSKYGEVRRMLQTLIASHPGTRPAARAKALLAEVDAKYVALAEEALDAATYSGQALAVRGDFDAAVGGVKAIARRFGDGPWLETTGAAKIDAAVAELEETKKRYAKKVTVKKRVTGSVDIVPRVKSVKHIEGRRFEVTYEWLVEEAPGADWRVFVHFIDPTIGHGENIAFQNDHNPTIPFSQWRAGQTVVDGPHMGYVTTNRATEDFEFVIGLSAGSRRPARASVGTLRVTRDGAEVTDVTYIAP